MVAHHPSHAISRRSVLSGLAAGALGGASALTMRHAAASDATPIPNEFDVEVDFDVTYGDPANTSHVLDVYRLPGHDVQRPAVIFLHGGAWKYGVGDRMDMAIPARALAAAGYVAFNVEYRRIGDPAGEHLWPAQLDDVQRAVRWIRANADTYGVDPDRIGAYGHSAGGHLASMLGVRETRDGAISALADDSSKVSCVVAIAAQYDLRLPYPHRFDRDAVVSLLGGTEDDVPDAYRDASPVTWVDDSSAPFLIIHGGADSGILPIHARTMVEVLHDAGIDVVSAEFARGDHFSVADWPTARRWTLPFFDAYLGGGD